MSKLRRRLSSKEFQELFANGTFIRGRTISLLLKPNTSYNGGFGVTLKKKKRNAVTRNYLKRRLREAFFRVQDRVPIDFDIVLIGNDFVWHRSLHDMGNEILHLIEISSTKRF